MRCYYHEGKVAVGTCVSCGKFICKECNIEIKGKNYCGKCIEALLEEKDNLIDELEGKAGNNNYVQQADAFPERRPIAYGPGVPQIIRTSQGIIPPYPRNNALIHVLLFCFTGGIGNIIYYLYIRDQQNRWEYDHTDRNRNRQNRWEHDHTDHR